MSSEDSIFAPLAEAIRAHNALPPYEKNLARGAGGAAIITLGLWFGLPILAQGSASPGVVIAWLVVMAFGVLWFRVGWRNSRAPRDPIKAWWSGVELVFGGFLLSCAYPSDSPGADWILAGIYLAIVVEGATGLVMTLRGLPPQGLPDPSRVPGMPMAGPASRREARRALHGRRDWQPPRFPD